jgi:hypothetical protein
MIDDEDYLRLYPEIHRRVLPYIDEAIDEFDNGGEELNEDSLNRMAQYAVSRSDLLRNPPPQWHNDRSVNDIVRGLLLSGLFGGGYYGYYPYPYPYRYPRPYPHFPGRRRGGRGGFGGRH